MPHLGMLMEKKLKINLGYFFNAGLEVLAQILPANRDVQPQVRPDFIRSQRDRETLPKTSLWQDVQDWSYSPIELQVNGKDVYVDKMGVVLIIGALLGYAGLAIYLRKFFK